MNLRQKERLVDPELVEPTQPQSDTPPLTPTVKMANTEIFRDWRGYIGLFDGHKTDDSNAIAKDFLDKMEICKTANGWNDFSTISVFLALLSGDTVKNWWEEFKRAHPNKSEVWKEIKAAFVKRFTTEITPERRRRMIDGLSQKETETVEEFKTRVTNVVNNTFEAAYVPESDADESRKKALRDMKAQLISDTIFSAMKKGVWSLSAFFRLSSASISGTYAASNALFTTLVTRVLNSSTVSVSF